MKRNLYIFCFVILGIILQQMIHTIVEMWYISLLLKDWEMYSLGLSWDSWFMIHHIGSVLLLIAGISLGYWQGKYWWPKLYDEAGKVRYPKPWRI